MKAKRVCIFPGALNLGGVGRNSINLAKEFIRQGYEVDFFLTKKTGEYIEQLPSEVSIFVGKGRSINSFIPFSKYMKQRRPQLLITARDYLNLAGFIGLKLSGVQDCVQLATIRTATSVDAAANKSILATLLKYLTKFLYPKIDHIVAVSGSVADDLAEYIGMGRERIEVVYNPIVTIENIEKGLGPCPDIGAPGDFLDKPFLLAVGRLTEAKRYHDLISAFSLIKNKVEHNLLILGEGELREQLVEQINLLGLEDRIFLAGYVSEPYAFMNKAEVVVSSSGWEGLPTVIVEALAFGTQVVATNCKGGSFEILKGGELGELVEVGDVGGLAELIIKVLENPKPKALLKARAQDFIVEKTIEKYLSYVS